MKKTVTMSQEFQDKLIEFIDKRFEDTDRRIFELSDYVKTELSEIKKEVKKTNGRVTDIEKFNISCPMPIVKETVERLDRSTKIIQILSEKPQLTITLVIIIALLAGLPNWLAFFGITG
jgi:phage/plasmid-associated DNA primase